MKSKNLKNIAVITIAAAILGGLFFLKNHRGQTPSAPQPPLQSSLQPASPKLELSQNSEKPNAAPGAHSDSHVPPPQAAPIAGAPIQKGPDCFQVTFVSKDVDERTQNNNFAFQKNLLKLPEVAFNPATVCVRVDGKPVRFENQKAKPAEFTIAPLKNIHSVVTASYCLGESKCSEPCQAPAEQQVAKVKDEFLEAIGGDDESELSKEYGKWEDNDAANAHNAKLEAALDPEIKRELANLDEEESKPKKAPRKLEIFSGWDRSPEALTCQKERHS